MCSSFSSSVFTKRCLGSRPRNQKAAFQWKGCNFAFCLCAFYECRESPAKAVPSTRIYYVDHNPFANDTVFAGESKELEEELKARIGKEERESSKAQKVHPFVVAFILIHGDQMTLLS